LEVLQFIQFFISVGYREARFGHRFCPQTYCNAPELAPGIVYSLAKVGCF
jgi:hypothetical protein